MAVDDDGSNSSTRNGDYSSDDSANHSKKDHLEYSTGKHHTCYLDYHQHYSDDHHEYSDDYLSYLDAHDNYLDDHHGYSDDHHGYSDNHHDYLDDHHYSDDRHGYSDDHRNSGDYHGYSDDLSKYENICCNHLGHYLNYPGGHHDDNCNYSPIIQMMIQVYNTTSDDLYGGQYLNHHLLKMSKVLPSISEPKSQEVTHPLQDAAFVAPNMVSDTRKRIKSQADTADISLQSSSHKSSPTWISFMPAFSATSEVPSKQIYQNSEKLIQPQNCVSFLVNSNLVVCVSIVIFILYTFIAAVVSLEFCKRKLMLTGEPNDTMPATPR